MHVELTVIGNLTAGSIPGHWSQRLFAPLAAGVPLADGLFRPLSEPQEAWHFVMASPPQDAETKTLDVTFSAGGRLNAIVFWFKLDLGSGVRLSTGPQAVSAGGHMMPDASCPGSSNTVFANDALSYHPTFQAFQSRRCTFLRPHNNARHASWLRAHMQHLGI